MNVIKTSRLKEDKFYKHANASMSRFKMDKKMNQDLDIDNRYDENVYANSYGAAVLQKSNNYHKRSSSYGN